MTYAFTHMGDFLLLLLLLLLLRNPLSPSLEALILARRLRYGLEEERREKIPHMCESIGHQLLRGCCPAPPSTSTLLKQGTGTADHLALLRLFSILFHLR